MLPLTVTSKLLRSPAGCISLWPLTIAIHISCTAYVAAELIETWIGNNKVDRANGASPSGKELYLMRFAVGMCRTTGDPGGLNSVEISRYHPKKWLYLSFTCKVLSNVISCKSMC